MNNMKNNFRLLVVALGIIVVTPVIAQKDNVGIGTTKPDQSAALDISSSNKGLLMPRMSLQQRSSIQNPAQGLVIYQTDFLSGFYFYDGKEWKGMASANSTASTEATNGTVNFVAKFTGVSTVDNSQIFDNGTNVGIGTTTPLQKLDVRGNIAIANGYIGGGKDFGNPGNSNNAILELYNPALGHSILNNEAYGIDLKTNTTSRLFISNNGMVNITNRLGIGTATPNAELEVNGIARFNSTYGFSIGSDPNRRRIHAYSSGQSFRFLSPTNAYEGIGVSSAAIGTNYTDAFTAPTNGLIVEGNVGIGTSNPTSKLYITNGNVKINTTTGYLAVGDFEGGSPLTTPAGYRLIVQDGILTEKIKVALKSSVADWADYVFEPSYNLIPLEKVEEFVKENKHLPNVPSAEDMVNSGLDVAKTSAKLMEKIEELTLYMIEMNKEIKTLKVENAKLRK
jgi:hypothetical protein